MELCRSTAFARLTFALKGWRDYKRFNKIAFSADSLVAKTSLGNVDVEEIVSYSSCLLLLVLTVLWSIHFTENAQYNMNERKWSAWTCLIYMYCCISICVFWAAYRFENRISYLKCDTVKWYRKIKICHKHLLLYDAIRQVQLSEIGIFSPKLYSNFKICNFCRASLLFFFC